ncbi:hypothetical protein BKA65DRAFT_549542 [Rhexocercosporidium sp. MPI-PUGE-AT-0058]|nr:hypothetical protein BKA65DRAFT_549542 [Rhexocercosporidium sp. MPI-PUGE-AT-0058]
MDYHVFGARVPVSSGELQPWDSKTGLDTTRPLRPNGGPAHRKGVGTHSSKGEASCSSKTSRRRKSRAVKSNVGTNNVDDESQESSNVFAQDSGIGAHNTRMQSHHLLFTPQLRRLCRILMPMTLGHASKRPHCTDPSQSRNIYASGHLPGEQHGPISNLLASHTEVPGFSSASATTAMRISDLPSLSYGSSSLQDPVPSQVPAYVHNPGGIWFNANMGYGVRQDDEGETSEPQAIKAGVNTQPGPEMAMEEGSENVGTSGLSNVYEFVDFSGGF